MTVDTATHTLPSPESIERAVHGSWLDAVAEAIAFARRLTNHEI